MNIQSSKNISKSSETLNDPNFSGVEQSYLRLNNQALQLFEHFGQPAHRQVASCNVHDMEPYSIHGNGLYSNVESPTTQTFVPFPRTHGYSPDIANAFAYNMKQLQENLYKFINHSDAVQRQNCMQRQHMSGYESLRWQETEYNTMVPSAYEPRLNESQTCIHRWF